MSIDIMDVRDAIMAAQIEANQIVSEAVTKFYEPDIMLKMALQAKMLPDEAWQYLDDQSKSKIMEVMK